MQKVGLSFTVPFLLDWASACLLTERTPILCTSFNRMFVVNCVVNLVDVCIV